MKKLLAGRITKQFGPDGGLVVNLYDTFPAALGADSPIPVKGEAPVPVWVAVDSLDVPLWIESFERRGRSSAVVRFADIDNERRSGEMVGREIFLPAAAADQSGQSGDELYFEDLVGYKALLPGGVTGTVAGFADNDLNPLFVLDVAGKEVLIPAVDEFLGKVSERRREVRFDIPEGLLYINED